MRLLQTGQNIATLARDQGALLIVDEIQTGCGRTGSFFAFEKHGIVPDIIDWLSHFRVIYRS